MALYNLMSYDNGGGDKDQAERSYMNKLFNTTLNIDNKKAIDIVKSVAKKTGLSPQFLGANAMQEGFNYAIIKQNKSRPFKDFPVDGFLYYGLDTFSDSADRLKSKGYLPKDFSYKVFQQENEKGRKVNSAAFKTNEDALLAKAAYLKDFQDQVVDYAKRKGINLNPNAKDYFTMSAYNGGMGNAKIMIDELASGNYNQDAFVSTGKTSRQGVHKNIDPRMKKMKWITQDFNEEEIEDENQIGGLFEINSPFKY